jgi:hypothetical protein
MACHTHHLFLSEASSRLYFVLRNVKFNLQGHIYIPETIYLECFEAAQKILGFLLWYSVVLDDHPRWVRHWVYSMTLVLVADLTFCTYPPLWVLGSFIEKKFIATLFQFCTKFIANRIQGYKIDTNTIFMFLFSVGRLFDFKQLQV